jgi:hypothetical protein
MRGLVALILLVAATGAYAGRPSLRPICGRVCDAVTGKPISGVLVVCREVGASRPGSALTDCADSVYTNAHGEYRIMEYDPMVTFSRPGYLTQLRIWTQLDPRQIINDPCGRQVQDVKLRRKP